MPKLMEREAVELLLRHYQGEDMVMRDRPLCALGDIDCTGCPWMEI